MPRIRHVEVRLRIEVHIACPEELQAEACRRLAEFPGLIGEASMHCFFDPQVITPELLRYALLGGFTFMGGPHIRTNLRPNWLLELMLSSNVSNKLWMDTVAYQISQLDWVMDVVWAAASTNTLWIEVIRKPDRQFLRRIAQLLK